MDKMTDQSSSTTFVDDSCSSSTDSTLYKRPPFLPVSEEQHPRKKRIVTTTTAKKWIAENDKTLNTTSWLQYEVIDRSYVSSLKCSMCAQVEDKLDGVRNFNRAFIEGSKNLRASAFKDHAHSDMHKRAMHLFKKSQSCSVTDYSPIARAFSSLDPSAEEKMKKRFDIAYWLCKEKLSFSKMTSLCEIEIRHGVDLGTGYKNNQACASFVHYIAKEQRDQLRSVLAKSRFFSIQGDGSTDSGNVEDELFVVLYFDPSRSDGRVHVRSKLLAVRQPKGGDAKSLFDCLVSALEYVEVSYWRDKLVGFGCDGANVNIAAGGLQGYLNEAVPWVVVFWCLAHRLELALKDSLNNTLFSVIDEMLLRVYYLYHNSPKKCRELDEVVQQLKMCLQEQDSDVPKLNLRGSRPIRACGTRFVTHKVAALNRLIQCFGAYLAHLVTLIEDPGTKSTEKAKLKGYLIKWRNSKMILGCALFHDLLRPASILCKSLQYDDLSVTDTVESLLHTSSSLEKLKDKKFTDYPSVKKVTASIVKESDGSTTYQETEIVKYDEAMEYLEKNSQNWCDAVCTCIKKRVKHSHLEIELLTSSLKILATQGWEKTPGADFAKYSLEQLSIQFAEPLKRANINTLVLEEEWEDMVNYAKRYLNIVQEDSSVIWWKLFNAACAKKWVNILGLVELLFALPMSNGRVERIFSALKLIKTDRRTMLSEDHLDDLLRISVDGPPASEWDATNAVRLWWSSKQRRRVGDTRTPPTPRQAEPDCNSLETTYELNLDDWDTFIA